MLQSLKTTPTPTRRHLPIAYPHSNNRVNGQQENWHKQKNQAASGTPTNNHDTHSGTNAGKYHQTTAVYTFRMLGSLWRHPEAELWPSCSAVYQCIRTNY